MKPKRHGLLVRPNIPRPKMSLSEEIKRLFVESPPESSHCGKTTFEVSSSVSLFTPNAFSQPKSGCNRRSDMRDSAMEDRRARVIRVAQPRPSVSHKAEVVKDPCYHDATSLCFSRRPGCLNLEKKVWYICTIIIKNAICCRKSLWRLVVSWRQSALLFATTATVPLRFADDE